MAAALKTQMKSIKAIKPSSPTPPHLQTFKLSFLEQRANDTHLNVNFFYPYSHETCNFSNSTGTGDVSTDGCASSFYCKSQLLQNSLSETLKLFYPFAGRLQDDAIIICNDEGVVFMESETNYSLSDILTSPDLSIVDRQLVPTAYPEATDRHPGCMILVNFVLFTCGGTAMCISTTHKIADMTSWTAFFKTWSAASRGIEIAVKPDLHIVATMFPPKQSCNKSHHSAAKYNSSMGRFVFSASKVQELKSKLLSHLMKEGYENHYPSRVEAVTALIWRCLMTSSKSNTGVFKPSVLFQAIDPRRRMDPPLAQTAIGHLAWLLTVVCEKESELELHELHKKMVALKDKFEEIGKIFSSKQLEELMNKEYEERRELFDRHNSQMTFYVCTAFCGFGHYEIDFAGMGKPLWVTTIAPEKLINFINLKDTRVKGEVEAVVFLDEKDMDALASNKELLQFAVINPTLM